MTRDDKILDMVDDFANAAFNADWKKAIDFKESLIQNGIDLLIRVELNSDCFLDFVDKQGTVFACRYFTPSMYENVIVPEFDIDPLKIRQEFLNIVELENMLIFEKFVSKMNKLGYVIEIMKDPFTVTVDKKQIVFKYQERPFLHEKIEDSQAEILQKFFAKD